MESEEDELSMIKKQSDQLAPDLSVHNLSNKKSNLRKKNEKEVDVKENKLLHSKNLFRKVLQKARNERESTHTYLFTENDIS